MSSCALTSPLAARALVAGSLWIAAGIATFAQLPQHAVESVAIVVVQKGTGSAFLIADGSYAVTNAHVVQGAQSVEVVFGVNRIPAGVVGTDGRDLAVLRLAQRGPGVPLVLSRGKRQGQTVYAVGYPGVHTQTVVHGPGGPTPSVQRGAIEKFDTALARTGARVIFVSSEIFPGSSGGALLDACGRVLGVTSGAVIDPISNMPARFAVDVADLVPLLDRHGIPYALEDSSCDDQPVSSSTPALRDSSRDLPVIDEPDTDQPAANGPGRLASQGSMPSGPRPVLRDSTTGDASALADTRTASGSTGPSGVSTTQPPAPGAGGGSSGGSTVKVPPGSVPAATASQATPTPPAGSPPAPSSDGSRWPASVLASMFGFGTVACLAGLVFALWIKRRRTPVAGTPEARSGDRVAPIVQLRGTTGDFRGRVISVGPAVLAIGRDPASCDLVIRDATRYVSRRHCRVSIEPGGHYLLVEDCGSTNGTFVGHVRLRPNDPRLIVPGERFRVGGPENEFEVAHPESPACLPARS